jgi:hypothetical protein
MRPKEKFETEFFNMLLDRALMSTKDSSNCINTRKLGGFLYKINELPKKEELIRHCADLQLALTIGSDGDIEGAPLCDELSSFKNL